MPVPRRVTAAQHTLLFDLLDDVFRRSKGVTDQSQATDFPLVFDPSNYSNCRAIVDDGRIVSHAALWPRELVVDGKRMKAAVIVSVATDPEFRQRGYAAACMQSLHETLHAEQYDIAVLWTAVPEFYGKLGWETTVTAGMILDVDAGSFDPPTSNDLEIQAFDADAHLDGVMDLHDREPVRFSRSRAAYRKLLNLPKVPVWVALGDGQVVAYLVHGQACNKQGLIEYGGDLEPLMSLAAHVLRSQPPGTTLSWTIFPRRPDLAAWAQSNNLPTRPLQSSKEGGHEMIRVFRPERISQHVREQLFVWGLDWA